MIIELPDDFPYEPFQQKVTSLLEASEFSDETGPKLKNHCRMGVCMTNAVFALLLSSASLMEYLNKLYESNMTVDFNEYINKIASDPYCKGPSFWHPPIGAFVNRGIIAADTHEELDSMFGLSGDYVLVRQYDDYKRHKWQGCDEEATEILAHFALIDRACEAIQSAKITASPFIRSNRIFKDIFQQEERDSVEMVNERMFGLKYISSLKFLNLNFIVQTMDVDLNFWQHRPLPAIPSLALYEDTRKELDAALLEHRIEPTYIQINFQQTALPEISPNLYLKMVKIIDVVRQRLMEGNGIDDISFDDFSIGILPLAVNLPESFGRDTTASQMGLNSLLKFGYEIRGFSFLLQEEEFIVYGDVEKSDIDDEITTECVIDIKARLNEFMNNLPEGYDLLTMEFAQVAMMMEETFDIILRDFCRTIHEKSHLQQLNRYESATVHGFSLIKRPNEEWWIISDESPIKIEDIKLAARVLRYENLQSIFYERIEY
ncbi:hypothetical protein SNEBB_009287 [Seison nebaliae]|nr:hypothetical protein SNEBB_009287 [Seison nebaliae]